MSLVKEFKAFALKGNVIDLAVAVVIGTAFGKIVSAIVEDLVMPVVGKVMPKGGWETYTLGGLRIGHLFSEILQFLIIALVLFVVVVKFMGALRRKDEATPPATRQCGECLEPIPVAARRCRACTSPQAV